MRASASSSSRSISSAEGTSRGVDVVHPGPDVARVVEHGRDGPADTPLPQGVSA